MAAPETNVNVPIADAWLVRPCELYKAEYKDCKSVGGRFHQHFVFGSLHDCDQWKKDYDNCMNWRLKKDQQSLVEVVDSEKVRRQIRLKGMTSNDTWELRTQPLSFEDWNRPLPDYLTKGNDGSYLNAVKMNGAAESSKSENSFCIIL